MIGYESAVPGSCVFGASEGQRVSTSLSWDSSHSVEQSTVNMKAESMAEGLDLCFGVSVGKGIDFEVVISNRTSTEHVCTARLHLS